MEQIREQDRALREIASGSRPCRLFMSIRGSGFRPQSLLLLRSIKLTASGIPATPARVLGSSSGAINPMT